MKNNESEEMYLETILLLKMQNPNVRSVDIASELSYSRPSVSRAVKLLQERGFITVGQDGEIKFTESGKRRANEIYERHQVITMLLERTGAPLELAEENACRIEHVISDEMFAYIKESLNKAEK